MRGAQGGAVDAADVGFAPTERMFLEGKSIRQITTRYIPSQPAAEGQQCGGRLGGRGGSAGCKDESEPV